MSKYIYFRKIGGGVESIRLSVTISMRCENIHHVLWTVLSFGRLRIYKVMNGSEVVAYAEVMPWIFIFGFMQKRNSIHIGPCWTKEGWRNKGIYTNLLRRICTDYSEREKFIFCSKDNIPSLKGIAKAGFSAFAEGYKSKGIYRIHKFL